MTDDSTRDLLANLASASPDAAWHEFQLRYSPLIRQITRQYESDPQRAAECFDHVCRALSDDGFRRLLRYRLDGLAAFPTWLTAVSANLCIDWQRRHRGRFRPLRAISRLPDLDQLVYRNIYVRGMTRTECLRALETRYPGLTEPQLSDINARLFALLTPQQRWRLGTRMAMAAPQADAMTQEFADEGFQLEDPAPGPNEVVQSRQEHERLAGALARLSPPQRLLLRLRYEQNLTLAEVARLTGLPDPFRARRQIETALTALAEIMGLSSAD